jgi:hypothetical protein
MLVEHCLPLETFLKVRGKNIYIGDGNDFFFSVSVATLVLDIGKNQHT